MKKALCLIALLSIVTTAAWAGDTYVPSNTPTSGTCNVIPFGGPWPPSNPKGEWRYQSYFTAADLGKTPFVITDISFSPCGTGTLSCTNFEVRISHTTSAASSSFATNLPKPVTVFSAKTFTYSFTKDQWSPLGLNCPFAYNGQDNLTIEIRYNNGKLTGHSGSFHRDTKVRIYKYGPGAYTATSGSVSNAALKVRITHADLTPDNQSPPYGITVTMLADSSADAGKFYFCASSLGTGSIPIGCWTIGLATDNLLFLTAQNLLPTVFVNYQGTLDRNGQAKAQIVIPKVPALVGVTLYSAYVVLGTRGIDSASPTTFVKIIKI